MSKPFSTDAKSTWGFGSGLGERSSHFAALNAKMVYRWRSSPSILLHGRNNCQDGSSLRHAIEVKLVLLR